MLTFSDSQETLTYLQNKYGSANYKSWQSLRRQFYSFVPYTEAGFSSYIFFNSAVGSGGLTSQSTNMPKAGSFGQVHFLIKTIKTQIYIADWLLRTWAGTDVSTLMSDYVYGFVQAGVFELTIGSRLLMQVPKPFLYMPPGDGELKLHSAGLKSFTLTEGTPNVLLAYITAEPFLRQRQKHRGIYKVDPNILIEAEQSFTAEIKFPTGIIPVIGTGVTDDTTNPLRIGVIMDGIVFRPVQ